MKKMLAALAAIFVVLALSSTPAFAKQEKVGICHSTGSASNPYVFIMVPADEANGHITGTAKNHNGKGTDYFADSKEDCKTTTPTPTPTPTDTPLECGDEGYVEKGDECGSDVDTPVVPPTVIVTPIPEAPFVPEVGTKTETLCLAGALVTKVRDAHGNVVSTSTVNGHADCAPAQGTVYEEEGF